ncbi:hypothetical protein O6P43_028262 [Quillaja saponaria]|uniref:Uncharacterized protein n=1 Tax=Quillaja saponaria TaxID=32244 RepID=A0AAD7P9R7_QUISA|nr:hypothetical protein O6P43_028262 [Quillaja saponaria]
MYLGLLLSTILLNCQKGWWDGYLKEMLEGKWTSVNQSRFFMLRTQLQQAFSSLVGLKTVTCKPLRCDCNRHILGVLTSSSRQFQAL